MQALLDTHTFLWWVTDDARLSHTAEPLPISVQHALLSVSFDTDHRDPFDRTLAAQSLIEGFPLITKDPAFASFGTNVTW